MARLSITVLVAAFIAIFPQKISKAQVHNCGNAREIAAKLLQQFGETITAIGVTASGNILAVYANADTQTWTVVTTSPYGVACVEHAGEAWATVKPVATGI